MSFVIFIVKAFIAGTINIGIVFYFVYLANTKTNKIINHLKLRYPDRLKELLGDEEVSNNKQSSVIPVKVGKFIRNNDLTQDIEYAQLKKEFLLNSRAFGIVLSAACLIESVFVLVPVFLFKQTSTDQVIVRLVPIAAFYGLMSFFWLVYQILKWNKSPNADSMPVDKEYRTEADNKNIIKFEISKSSVMVYKNYPVIGTLGVALIFVIFVMCALSNKANGWNYLLSQLHGILIFCGVLYIFVLLGVYRVWRGKLAYVLTFDQENKEFSAYIGDRKKEIKFWIKDIKEVSKEPSQGGFRFYLNNGTWITWDSAFTNKRQDLENLVKSNGVSVRTQSFW